MGYNWSHDYPKIARESGFKLRQIKNGSLDWRLISSVEVEKIVRDQDFERVDGILTHIIEAPLGLILDSNILDSGVAKYFNLAQLSVQYLLFCKKFLDQTVNSLRKSLEEVQIENVRFKKLYRENNDELLQLHKKFQRIEEINQIVFPCTICTKNFISNEMLNIHMKRKHQSNGKSDGDNDRNLINTIKLELEIKQLKERLNVAEKEIRIHHYQPESYKENEKSDTKILLTPRTMCSASTQSDINTRNIGIQSNLNETKEIDENDELIRHEKDDILNELREKIASLENLKTKEIQTNEKSINEIKYKLEEIVLTLENKIKRDDEIQTFVNHTKENGENSIQSMNELRQFFTQTIMKLCAENEAKLMETVQKIELGYENKIESLNNIIEKVNLSKTPTPRHQEKAKDKPVEEIVKIPEKILQVAGKEEADIIEYSSETESSQNDDIQNLHKKIITVQVEPTKDLEKVPEEPVLRRNFKLPKQIPVTSTPKKKIPKQTEKIPKEKRIELQIPKKNTPEILFNKNDAWKLAKKRLKMFGINSGVKALSSGSANEISRLLAEKRHASKKSFPTFFVTRNKLKTAVDKITKERIEKLNLKTETEYPKSLELKDLPTRNYELKPKIDPVNDINQFKKRLEKILDSPVRKPITKYSTNGNNIITNVKKFESIESLSSKENQKNDDTIKPVPAPRRKVLFDFEKHNNEIKSSPDTNEDDNKSNRTYPIGNDSDISTISSL